MANNDKYFEKVNRWYNKLTEGKYKKKTGIKKRQDSGEEHIDPQAVPAEQLAISDQPSSSDDVEIENEQLFSEMIENATTIFISENPADLKKTTVEEMKAFEKEQLFSKADQLMQSEESLLTETTSQQEAEYMEAVTDTNSNDDSDYKVDSGVVDVGVNEEDILNEQLASNEGSDEEVNRVSAMIEADMVTDDDHDASQIFAIADQLLNEPSDATILDRLQNTANIVHNETIRTTSKPPEPTTDITCEVQTETPNQPFATAPPPVSTTVDRQRRDESSTHVWEQFEWLPSRMKKDVGSSEAATEQLVYTTCELCGDETSGGELIEGTRESSTAPSTESSLNVETTESVKSTKAETVINEASAGSTASEVTASVKTTEESTSPKNLESSLQPGNTKSDLEQASSLNAETIENVEITKAEAAINQASAESLETDKENTVEESEIMSTETTNESTPFKNIESSQNNQEQTNSESSELSNIKTAEISSVEEIKKASTEFFEEMSSKIGEENTLPENIESTSAQSNFDSTEPAVESQSSSSEESETSTDNEETDNNELESDTETDKSATEELKDTTETFKTKSLPLITTTQLYPESPNTKFAGLEIFPKTSNYLELASRTGTHHYTRVLEEHTVYDENDEVVTVMNISRLIYIKSGYIPHTVVNTEGDYEATSSKNDEDYQENEEYEDNTSASEKTSENIPQESEYNLATEMSKKINEEAKQNTQQELENSSTFEESEETQIVYASDEGLGNTGTLIDIFTEEATSAILDEEEETDENEEISSEDESANSEAISQSNKEVVNNESSEISEAINVNNASEVNTETENSIGASAETTTNGGENNMEEASTESSEISSKSHLVEETETPTKPSTETTAEITTEGLENIASTQNSMTASGSSQETGNNESSKEHTGTSGENTTVTMCELCESETT